MSFIDRLDVLGCQPSLFKLYTQVAFVYAFDATDDAVQDRVTTALRNGLDRLSAQLPWLCGNVVNEHSAPRTTGTYRIVHADEIALVVKHLGANDSSEPLTLDRLRRAHYPFSLLNEELIAPCMTLNPPGQTLGLAAENAPILAVQLNYMSDGLILTVVGQHNVMDMVGQANIISWLSKACHGQQMDTEQLAVANMDKSQTLTLFDQRWTPDPDWLNSLRVAPARDAPCDPDSSTRSGKVSWAYVAFSPHSVRALKQVATQTKHAHSGYISSDDAVCAFIWKCVSRARTASMDGGSCTVFARAVDVRGRMNVPCTYPGTLTNMTYNHSTLRDVSAQPLGVIAASLRGQLNSSQLSHDTRALATVIDRLQDKASISITAPVAASTGIMLSSWASVQLHHLDFGLQLGAPVAVRRPSFAPVESLMYIMPKCASSGAVVGMCLRDRDWAQLERDAEWTRHATFLG